MVKLKKRKGEIYLIGGRFMALFGIYLFIFGLFSPIIQQLFLTIGMIIWIYGEIKLGV